MDAVSSPFPSQKFDRNRPVVFDSRHLPVWMALSIVVHMLLLSVAGGGRPSRVSHASAAPLIADIRQVVQERAVADTAADLEPETRKQPRVSEVAEAAAALHFPRTEARVSTGSQRPSALDGYFPAAEVDVPAYPTNDAPLRYPWMEYWQRLGGVVRMALLISEHGRLDSVTIIEATPPGHFEEAAIEAVRKLQFMPALKYGRPVKSRKTIEVVFDPSEHPSPASTI